MRSGIKSFLESTIAQFIEYPEAVGIVRKLNVALVSLLKKSWPASYPTYFIDTLTAARSNKTALANVLSIFTMFAEEVFDFHKDSLTRDEKSNLSAALGNQVQPVIDLSFEILANPNPDMSILSPCLSCLQQFVSWMATEYVFTIHKELHKNLPTLIVDSDACWSAPELVNSSLLTLTKVVEMLKRNEPNKDIATFTYLFLKTVRRLQPFFSDPNFAEDALCNEAHLQISSSFVLFVNSFLAYHADCLYTSQPPQSLNFTPGDLKKCLQITLNIVVVLTHIEDDAVYKNTRDFWTVYAKRFRQTKSVQVSSQNFNLIVEMLSDCFRDARLALIQHIGKPKEVLVITEETGETYEESRSDTMSVNRYLMTKEALGALCSLDANATTKMMSEIIVTLCNIQPLNHNELNACTWASGSIATALGDDAQRTFICAVLQPLLKRCNQSDIKSDRAILASSIMYITSQYPRFLKSHWAFYKVVINKLLDFTKEDFPGVCQMAVETLFTLFENAPGPLITDRSEENAGIFLEDILSRLDQYASYLSGPRLATLYRALAHVIEIAPRYNRERYVTELMLIPNARFDQIAEAIMTNPSLDALESLIDVLRINSWVFYELRETAIAQLRRIWGQCSELFNVISNIFNQEYGKANADLLKRLKACKTAIMEVLGAFVGGDVRGIDVAASKRNVTKPSVDTVGLITSNLIGVEARTELMEHIVPTFFNSVITQFGNTPAASQDPQTLVLVASILEALGVVAAPLVLPSFEYLVTPVYNSVLANPSISSEFLPALMKLLLSFCAFCPSAMAPMPVTAVTYIFQILNDNISHYIPEVSATAAIALSYLYCALLECRVYTDIILVSQLLAVVLANSLTATLGALTDKMHSASTDAYTLILCQISQALRFCDNSGDINSAVKVFEQADVLKAFNIPHNYTNIDAVSEWMKHMIRTQFPQVPDNIVENFVLNFKDASSSNTEFKRSLADFLIKSKQIAQ